jgi:hypothetical protein
MPNWCSNFASIRGPKERIAELKEAYDNGEFCNAVIPVPQELKDAVADGSTNEALIDKYGYSNWYDFCVNRWGTKWDVGADGGGDVEDGGECLTISFDSAWSPPCGVYEQLDLEGLTVEAYYYEGGMAYCGKWTSESGDEYWEIGGMTADEVADTIPTDLDDCMGITECMRDYEESERMEDDLYRWTKEGGEQLGLVEKS